MTSLAKSSFFSFLPSFLFQHVSAGYNFNSPMSNKLRWRLFYEYVIRSHSSCLLPIWPRNSKYPVYIRGGTTDITNFVSVFVHEEYGFISNSPRTIIDLGGSIGISSAYFALKFPESRILVIEPDPVNYALCLLNNRFNANVVVENVGVWSHDIHLQERSRLYGDMSINFSPADPRTATCGYVQAYSITTLLNMFGFSEVDFLKVDIEGAELDVFSGNAADQWLPRVHSMSVEIHESKFPGCDFAVRSAAARHCFSESTFGEYAVFTR